MAKINIDNVKGFDPIRTERKADVKGAHNTPVKYSGPEKLRAGDMIRVSDKAAEIGKMVSQMNELPDVRSERVEALQARVAAGTFAPSGTEIADAILKSERS